MAEKKKGRTVFRRIRGRIVPIKLSKVQQERLEGTAIVALGGGTTVGGALFAGHKLKKVRQFTVKSRIISQNTKAAFSARLVDVLKGTTKASKRVAGEQSRLLGQKNKALKELQKAEKEFGKVKKINSRSRFLAATLVGVGANKVIGSFEKKEGGLLPDFTSETIGFGSAVAVESLGKSVFLKKASGKSVFKSFGEDAIKGFKKAKDSGAISSALKKIAKLKFKI